MEEWVGGWYDRLVRKAAERTYPQASAALASVLPRAPLLLQAWSGEAGLAVKAASARVHTARRNWREKLAGTGDRLNAAYRDSEGVYLPDTLACFPDRTLNETLYLWLLAQLSFTAPTGLSWLESNRQATLQTLSRLPGLGQHYQQLVAAALALRPDPATLPPDEAQWERAIVQVLQDPSQPVVEPAPARRAAQAVPLWRYPAPSALASQPNDTPAEPEAVERGRERLAQDTKRRQAEQVEEPDGKAGFMLPFRAESLMSWAEYVRVNRPTEEDDEPGRPQTADDLNHLSVARGGSTRAKLRFDLDLPAAAHDDRVLGEGIRLPEWDWKQQQLRPDYCRILPMLADQAVACALPPHLQTSARQLRQRFTVLAPRRERLNRQPQGDELDLDAVIRHLAEPAGQRDGEAALYRDTRLNGRSLACLLLADLSLSTDTWVNNDGRVIDVIRDSLFLFAEALAASGDRFGLYGFSSVKRSAVRYHLLKDFADRYDDIVRGRIAAIKPGFYTRMGAAIRQSTRILAEQAAERRLLLVLTDGKPNDLDHYEGRYGIEDTRQAVIEARQAGLIPFCVTIDEEGGNYLPHLFGSQGYVRVDDAARLPMLLPKLYLQLTRR